MPDDNNRVIKFPHSRVPVGSTSRAIKELGLTKRAAALDPEGRGAHGHWCSHCRGIWYGRAGEVECPVCGNRHG